MSTITEAEQKQAGIAVNPKLSTSQVSSRPAPPPLHLFEDVLLSQSGTDRNRRTASAVISIIIESLFLAVIVIVPLMYTEVLPTQQLVTFLIAPPPPPPPPPPPAAAPVKAVQIQSNIVQGELRTPTRVPKRVEMIREDAAPPALGGVEGGVAGGIPGGTMGGVIGGIISSAPAVLPKAAPPKVLRVSQGVSRGLLIRRVEPVYPMLAKQARIQGEVVLNAIIGKDGAIENLQVERGHPLLAAAAVDAVKQWRFKPFLLNGEPIEIETIVNVNFVLSQ